jgi:uncharacterized protein YbaP (TraB family)
MNHQNRRFSETLAGISIFRSMLAVIVVFIINLPSLFSQVDSVIVYEEIFDEGRSEINKNDGPKKYPSLMWEITGPGMRKPSYLYGSMHVSRKIAFHLGDTFFMAVKAVDVVALESNPGEWMDHYTNSEYYRKATTTSANYLNKYQYRNFYRDAFFPDLPEVKTFSSLLAKRYNVMNHMLYRKNEALSDFEEKTYLDLFIFQAGTKAGKQVIGLEDFEVSREMVREAETPPKKRDPNQKVTREQSKLRYRYGELIEDAYRKGDLDLLDSISRMMDPYPKYHTYMIVKRNEVMANTIDSVIRSGRSIFAACGAAHLPGDSGVIEMLRSMGYTMRPITRTINRSQNKAKDKIDAQVVKLPVKTWHSPDGDFSADLPGPMYSSVLFSNHGEYFYPDMVNGSYYVVNRFPTFAPLRRHTVNDVKARFDSLLYEFVPGKINRFKETSVGGFPAYDISATTSRGDVQQYLLAFTPMEVMVFKMSGPGKYVKKEQASKKFFSSIKLNMADHNAWKPVPQGKLGFAVNLPSYRILDTAQVFERTTKDLVFQGFDFADSSYYLLIRGSYHDFDYIEEDTFELNFMAEQLAQQYDTEVASRILKFDQDGYPCIDFTMEKENSSHCYRGMITIAGPSYYLLLTTGKDEKQHEKFFNSFRIDPPSYKPGDFYTFKDTTLLFEVQTVCDPPEKSEGSSGYYWYYGSDDEKDKSHQSEDKSTYFFNHASGEFIKVDYRKFHKYAHYANPDTLWKSLITMYDSDSTLIRSNISQSDSGLINTCTVTFTDTNSSRAILIRMIQKHGAWYRLSTVTDTLNGPSEFVKTFYETFSPLDDTLVGWLVFADKGEMYLSDLVAEDSTIRAQARESFNIVRFSDHHAPLLMQRITNPNYDEMTFAFRRNLILDLGRLKHPDIPAFLERQYGAIGDTVTFQLAILRALARQKTPEASKTILKCLKYDLPLTSSDSDIGIIFSAFGDSLQAAKALFPEIFTYTRYREYEDNIYDLLATLLDSNLVTTKDYKSEYQAIYRNARDYWKRQLAREEEAQDKKSEYYTGYKGYTTHGGTYNSNLLVYVKLLLPYYAAEPGVRKLVDNVMRSNTSNLKIKLTGIMLSANVPVPDSVLSRLSKDPYTMADFYKELATRKKISHFDTTGLNQIDFSRSILIKESSLNERDSLVYLDRQYVETVKGNGYIYFFKKKKDKEKSWNLVWVGIQPEDTTKVVYEDYMKDSYGSRIYDNDKIEELIEKEMKSIRLKGRKRAERLSFDKDNYFYLFF